MILIDDTAISDDIADKMFVCDLDACKGACCVEGDLGAPLEEDETEIIEKIYPIVKPYLSEAGIRAIEELGLYVKDWEGDYSTPTVNGRECAFAYYDENNIVKCGFEEAYNDGKTGFKKPISCHLYPIRVTKYEHFHALNYERWDICDAACTLGEKLGVPLYKFLKEALIRAYGEDWYTQLVEEIENGQF